MSIAELHGKLAETAKTEDMLTSDVFGALELLGDAYLRAWVKGALGFGVKGPINNLEERLPPVGTTPRFLFWPTLPSSHARVPGCEPDVLILWGELALVVEVKYGAPKSGAGLEEDESLLVSEELDRHNLVDQLGRQWIAAQALTKGYGLHSDWPLPKRAEVLFVTQDFGPPLGDIEESLSSTATKAGTAAVKDVRFYWASCRRLFDTLEFKTTSATACPHENIVASRLSELLKRKGLLSFHGFPGLTEVETLKGSCYTVQYLNQADLPHHKLLIDLPVFTYSKENT